MKGAIAVVWGDKGKQSACWRDKVQGVLMVAQYPHGSCATAQDYIKGDANRIDHLSLGNQGFRVFSVV